MFAESDFPIRFDIENSDQLLQVWNSIKDPSRYTQDFLNNLKEDDSEYWKFVLGKSVAQANIAETQNGEEIGGHYALASAFTCNQLRRIPTFSRFTPTSQDTNELRFVIKTLGPSFYDTGIYLMSEMSPKYYDGMSPILKNLQENLRPPVAEGTIDTWFMFALHLRDIKFGKLN